MIIASNKKISSTFQDSVLVSSTIGRLDFFDILALYFQPIFIWNLKYIIESPVKIPELSLAGDIRSNS